MQNNRPKQLFVFLLPIVVFVSTVNGQLPAYHVQFFDEDHGIRTGNYQRLEMTKDSANFLWLLQTNTIQRFDGKQVVEFRFDETLISILCDGQGRVWVTSDTKVWRFDSKLRKFTTVAIQNSEGIAPGIVFSFVEKKVWLHSTSGFFQFDEEREHFKRVLTQVSQTRNISRRNFAYFNHVLYFQYYDTLFCYDIVRGMTRGIVNPPGVYLFAVSENLALSTNWQYNSFWHDFNKMETNPTLVSLTATKSAASHLFVSDFGKLDQHNFLMATQLGFLQFNIETKEYKKIRYYRGGKLLPNTGTGARIYIDAENTVWLGFFEGIAHYQHFKEGIGLMRNNESDRLNTWTGSAFNFTEDHSGDIWFVNGNGFARWNQSTDIITSFPPVRDAVDRLSHYSVRGVAYDGKYIILGPTDKGVWLFEPVTKKFRRPVYPTEPDGEKVKISSERDFVDQIRTLHNGNHMIVGRDALYLLNGKTYELSIVDNPAGKENANFVHEDSENRIWVGTGRGLHCLDSNLTYRFKLKDTLGTLRSFCIWGQNEILVSGSRGIFHITSKTDDASAKPFHSFFKGMSINLIYKDRNAKLWVGTHQGLYRVDSTTKNIELFDHANNIQGNGFNNDASFLSSSNVLFLGGVNGINYFVPEKLPANNHFLKVSILKVRVNDDDSSYATGTAYKLLAHQRSIEISFTAPYFNNPAKVRYRYMLEGYDKEWKSTGNNNSVLFTSLPAGEFHFRVSASIDDVNWYNADQQVSFTIAPHFWQTWWFIGLIQLSVALIIYLIYKNRLNKRLAVERFRTSISRDLHDDIGSTLSSINILAKSSLLHHSEDRDEKAVLLRKIQERSQKMLDAMDDLIWNTKPGNESIESLVIRMREYATEVLEPAGIIYTIDCPASLFRLTPGITQRKNLYLIFKEAVNNLAKYSQSKRASVFFSYERKQLQLTIQDEGVGFQIDNGKRGNGLENMRSRALEMGAKLDINSEEGGGTLVRLTMPL